MNSIKLDLKRRLARVEITPSATHWADLEAASHRKQLRALIAICQLIRERFLLMGLDPALAVSLHIGEDASQRRIKPLSQPRSLASFRTFAEISGSARAVTKTP